MKLNYSFFDTINKSNQGLVKKLLQQNYCIYYFSASEKIRRLDFFKKASDSGFIVNMYDIEYDVENFLNAIQDGYSNIDECFECSKDEIKGVLGSTSGLYNSDKLVYMYKKRLLQLLRGQYDREYRIITVSERLGGSSIYYSEFDYRLKGFRSLLSSNVNIEFMAGNARRNHLYELLILFYPFFILLKKFGGIKFKEGEKKKFSFAINLNLPKYLTSNFQYIFYAIDPLYGNKKEDYIFVDERSEPDPEDLIDNGYNYCNFFNGREQFSPGLIKKIFLNFIPCWIKCFFYSLSNKNHNISVTRTVLSDFVKWNIFTDNYSVNSFFTVLLPDNISKNEILKQNNVRTKYFYPDNYCGDYHHGSKKEYMLSIVYCYMYYDLGLFFGNKVVSFFRSNINFISEYLAVGVPSGQRVHEIREGIIPNKMDLSDKFGSDVKKIISVFDTSYILSGVLDIDDGIIFAQDVLKLLDEFEDLGIIFKEKKNSRLFYPEFDEIYSKIQNNPRCFFVYKDNNESVFASDVIAVADMVISAAYTSTNAEALSSKTKAVYYDVNGKNIGDDYYFNHFPNFVAHNYSQLRNLVNYWLYENSEEEFERLLMNHAVPDIDPYLDFKAIDRINEKIRE